MNGMSRKDKFFPKIEVTRENAKMILDLFAEKLKVKRFSLSYYEEDSPSMTLSLVENDLSIDESICPLIIESVRSGVELHAEERHVGVDWASDIYEFSPIMFKQMTSMTLDDFSFWMRVDLDQVREECCRALLDRLCEAPFGKCIWRMWQGHEWIEIDPWKFAVEHGLRIHS